MISIKKKTFNKLTLVIRYLVICLPWSVSKGVLTTLRWEMETWPALCGQFVLCL